MKILKIVLCLALIPAGALEVARCLLMTDFIAHRIGEINNLPAVSDWRGRHGWVGLDANYELLDLIALSIGVIVSSFLAGLLYNLLNRLPRHLKKS